MSSSVEGAVAEAQHEMGSMRMKVDNLFNNAERVLSREDFVKVISTLGAAVRHLLWMAGKAVFELLKMIAFAIGRFVRYVAARFGEAKAKYAEGKLAAAQKIVDAHQ